MLQSGWDYSPIHHVCIIQELRADSESRERRLREELRGKEAEVSNLTEELRKRRQGQQQEEARKVRGGKQEEEARKVRKLL